MSIYHKIQSIFKRDEKTHKFIEGKYSLPEFEYLKDNIWTFTEKVDGRNTRIYWYSNPLVQTVEIKGRTDKADIPAFLYDKLKEIFPKEKMIKVFGIGEDKPDICLYGEGYGNRIQGCGKNYNSNGVDFVLFDVKIGKWWLKREDVNKIAKSLNIDVVPIVGEGTLDEAVNFIKTQGLYSKWGDFLAEGMILRPKIELKSRNGQRIITKIKHTDFPDYKNK